MKSMVPRTMMSQLQSSSVMKIMAGKKRRMMPNHKVHVINRHGKVMAGRKGRTT